MWERGYKQFCSTLLFVNCCLLADLFVVWRVEELVIYLWEKFGKIHEFVEICGWFCDFMMKIVINLMNFNEVNMNLN